MYARFSRIEGSPLGPSSGKVEFELDGPDSSSKTECNARRLKHDVCRSRGAGGIVIRKTVQILLIGIYDETISPGNSAQVVEKLGDYLEENGY
uniref:Profilin-5-like n=1 Tax=Nicotiana sylvestris TaxID=4096 RepID=A0A1U7V8F3_NICSY|nr:PREDICTED: profilin-5-like [Nicotiana sylvestris]